MDAATASTTSSRTVRSPLTSRVARNPDLYDRAQTVADEDEEEFAETFAIVVYNGAASPAYRAIIQRYVTALAT